VDGQISMLSEEDILVNSMFAVAFLFSEVPSFRSSFFSEVLSFRSSFFSEVLSFQKFLLFRIFVFSEVPSFQNFQKFLFSENVFLV
jgi:hypothetical protein